MTDRGRLPSSNGKTSKEGVPAMLKQFIEHVAIEEQQSSAVLCSGICFRQQSCGPSVEADTLDMPAEFGYRAAATPPETGSIATDNAIKKTRMVRPKSMQPVPLWPKYQISGLYGQVTFLRFFEQGSRPVAAIWGNRVLGEAFRVASPTCSTGQKRHHSGHECRDRLKCCPSVAIPDSGAGGLASHLTDAAQARRKIRADPIRARLDLPRALSRPRQEG
jgi:hypothetical protein